MIARIGTIFGYLLMVLGSCEILPLCIAYFNNEKNLILPFVMSSLFTVFVGGALTLSFQSQRDRTSRNEVILLLVVIWFGLPVFASLPFMITGFMTKFTYAYFEAASALTTTGSSLVLNLDIVPSAILFWRALLQWFGGILVFVMAVAILPLTSIGGIEMFRSVLPHGEGDDLLARIRYAFTPLMKIYSGMTIACVALLAAFGIEVFDAILMSMATVSSGGFTSQGVPGVNSMNGVTEFILMPFMIFAATNMTFHWAFFQKGRGKIYQQDPEIFNFLYIMLVAIFLIFIAIVISSNLQDVGIFKKMAIAIFTAVSSMTTTGFLPDQATSLPLTVSIICMILLFIGGTTGSTAGGFKILRISLMKRHADKEINRLVFPNSITPVTINGLVVSNKTLISVWALLFVFITGLAIIITLFGLMGFDFQTSFGLGATSIFSAGGLMPLINPEFVGYHSLSYAGKWLVSVAMILGRLEIIAALVLLMPSFWKK